MEIATVSLSLTDLFLIGLTCSLCLLALEGLTLLLGKAYYHYSNKYKVRKMQQLLRSFGLNESQINVDTPNQQDDILRYNLGSTTNIKGLEDGPSVYTFDEFIELLEEEISTGSDTVLTEKKDGKIH